MRSAVISMVIAILATAPAYAVTITLTPITVAQSSLPTIAHTCASPNVPASVDAAFFEMPQVPAAQGITGMSVVRIDLSEKGSLTSQTLYSSSGNSLLDEAALRSARMSRFSSEVRNCDRVAGTYLYAVDFSE